MAQELTTMRSPAAYAGVTAYAHAHTGEAASAAYLALGHAYLLDHRYSEAAASFQKANERGKTMDDYADFLAAQAVMEVRQALQCRDALNRFCRKYPESLCRPATGHDRQPLPRPKRSKDGAKGSAPTPGRRIAYHADFQLALARANQMTGSVDEPARAYRHIFLSFPLSNEGAAAKTQLAVVGGAAPLTVTERRARADALYAGGRMPMRAKNIARWPMILRIRPPGRNALLVAAAALRLQDQAAVQGRSRCAARYADESGARRLYLAVEVARNHDDSGTHQALVTQMEQRFPDSPWLAEALYTSANMYLLRKDYPQAIAYYTELATRFHSPLRPQQPLEGSLAELPFKKLLQSRTAFR